MKLRAKQYIDNYAGKAILLFNVVFVRLLGLLFRRDHSLKKAPDHILVIKILGLGSVFMALDSLNSLKNRYPDAKLHLICGKGVKDGIAPLLLFDSIKVIDDSDMIRLLSSSLRALLGCWRMKNLWIIDLEVYSVLTTIFSSWTFALNRFGFQLNKVHFRHYLNTHNIYFNQFINVEQNYKSLMEAAGVKQFKPFAFKTSVPEASALQKEFIAINNTCSELGGNLRKMTDSVWKEICDHIMDKTSYKIALTGAPSDRKQNDVFIERWLLNKTERVINIAGIHPFSEYYNFLHSQCAMMISIDSAPLHIARKLGIPTLSLWGPINPEQRISFRNDQQHKNAVYYLGVPCSPCIHLTEVVPCGGNNICMKDMDSKSIFPLIENVLNHIAR